MEAEELKEGNILIAEFMRETFQAYKDNNSYDKKFSSYSDCEKWIKKHGLEGYAPELFWRGGVGNYNLSWKSLMPVVEKIEQEFYIRFQISGNTCWLSWTGAEDEKNLHIMKAFDGIGVDNDYQETKIEATWKGCVEFIKWANSKVKTKVDF